MKRLLAVILAILACLTLGAYAQGPFDLNAGSQIAYSGSTGAYTFSWWGTAGNTYLIETSDDLVNWTYLPIVETGFNTVTQWGFTSTSSNLFLRLEYITVPANQLSGSVFNGPDNNGNGLPDDWELFYFGYLGVDPNLDPDGEGFTNLQDYQNGNNPIANQVVSVGPPVGEYLFHETSGTVAHDISSLHNNGTLSGGAGWTMGGYDGQGAVTFDGTNGEILISNTGNRVLPATGAPFSFAFWFNSSLSLTGTSTIITDGTSGNSGFEFGIDSTTSPPSLLFSTRGAGGVETEAPIQSGTWTHAAVTFDGTTATVYVDGFALASGTGVLVSNTNAIALGDGLSGAHPFAGAMENLTFYHAVLQPFDVNSLFNLSTTTTGPDPSGMANWWKYQYFGTLNVNPNAYLPWSGEQMTNLQAYEQGLNPIDFYSGQTPMLQYVSGASQTGSSGGFVSLPLVVSVTDTNGNPLYNAPVTFAVTSGSGYVQVASTAAASGTLKVLADQSGSAQVFFKLPASLSSTSEVTATAGPPAEPASVVFTEMSDTGGHVYPSPFIPTNIEGNINADGSETITWQNNDNQSPIYVYELTSSSTWMVSGTLAAGTTSYIASAASVGSVEIGNNYSAGGSTGRSDGGSGAGGSGGGGSGSGGGGSGGGDGGGSGGSGGSNGSSPNGPGGFPLTPIAAQNYAAIVLSGTTTTTASGNVALDDNNNLAFGYYDSSSNYNVYTVQAGLITPSQVFNSGTFSSGDETIYGTGVWNLGTNGTCYGNDTYATVGGTGVWTTEVQYSQNNPSPLFPPNPPYGFGEASEQNAEFYLADTASNGYCGYGGGLYLRLGGTNGYTTSGGGVIICSSTTTIFDPNVINNDVTAPGVQLISAIFDPSAMNANGWAYGVIWNGSETVPGVWTTSGTTPLLLAPMQSPVAINDIGQIISADGYLWTPSGGGTTGDVVTISSLIPSLYQNQVSNINPIDISGTNASGIVGILFDATYQTDSEGDTNYGPLLLTITSTSTSLTQVSVPSNIITSLGSDATLNAQGLITTLGAIITGTTQSTSKDILLVPSHYQQSSPNSGFDWVSQPNWLMVPVTGTNQAIAQTAAASATFPVGFSIQASSSNSQLTVSPTSTTSSNQTITVTSSGTNSEETYQVQVGVGIASSSGTNSSGLGLDVKPMTTKTVAIHAVTQHYTQAMPPPSPSGGWAPNQVCVTATGGILWSTPGGDDVQSGLTITTGSDGLCETTADPHDTQVIPVGWGIPKDIVPQDTPSASDLQTYLNQVFGKQANLFFTVTRNDFSANYDILPKINGILDITESQGARPSAEQKVIEGNASPGVNFNVFYVADYQGLVTGTAPADHGSIGISYYTRHVAYVRDTDVTLNVSAHEIGHLLDLGHTDWTFLPDASPNTAGPKYVQDPSPSDRLMFPVISGSNTFLIKPEWDIINLNNPPKP
jgi:hypothetical protein